MEVKFLGVTGLKADDLKRACKETEARNYKIVGKRKVVEKGRRKTPLTHNVSIKSIPSTSYLFSIDQSNSSYLIAAIKS